MMTRKEVSQCLKDARVQYRDQILIDPRRLIFNDMFVFVDGQRLCAAPEKRVFAFHKPRGFISAHASYLGKPTIGPYIERMGKNLTHIGRLDKETTGLLLVTNDGDLCHALTDPSCRIGKKYELLIEGSFEDNAAKIEKLSQPIRNRKTKVETIYNASKIKVLECDEESFIKLELVLYEGKNRQIRRMCAILGLSLHHLHRVSVGRVAIGELIEGDFRRLEGVELEALYAPFGGIWGLEKQRLKRLLQALKTGAFLPDITEDVKEWVESYLG